LSPTVVNARIGDLREAKLVELLPGEGYVLKPDRRSDEMLLCRS